LGAWEANHPVVKAAVAIATNVFFLIVILSVAYEPRMVLETRQTASKI